MNLFINQNTYLHLLAPAFGPDPVGGHVEGHVGVLGAHLALDDGPAEFEFPANFTHETRRQTELGSLGHDDGR